MGSGEVGRLAPPGAVSGIRLPRPRGISLGSDPGEASKTQRPCAGPGRALPLYTEDTEGGPASRARGEHREAVRAPRTGPPPPFYLRKQPL